MKFSINTKSLVGGIVLLLSVVSTDVSFAAQSGYCWNEKVGWTDMSGVTFNALTKKLGGTANYPEGIYGGGAFTAGAIDFTFQGAAGVTGGSTVNGGGNYPLTGQAFSEQAGWFVANHAGTNEAVTTPAGALSGNFWTDELGWFECSAADIGAANTQIWDEANVTDTDSDGITDEEEAALCVAYPAVDNCPAGNPAIAITPLQDSDGDGITDIEEVQNETNPLDPNDPNVGAGNDDDGDGIANGVETAVCTAYPAVDNCPATTMTEITPTQDTDGDGIPDVTEVLDGTDPTDANDPTTGGNNDSDGDGITDGVEAWLEENGGETAPGTTPSTDTDGDGIPDATEVADGTDPFDVDSPTTNGDNDADGDGVTDAVEEWLEERGGETAPNTTPSTDTDGDGIPDATEVANGTDPFDGDDPTTNGGNDTDGDGITDGVEVAACAIYPTLDNCPSTTMTEIMPSQDTDGDGIPDATEIVNGTDPTDANSPTTGGNNDSDGDGITDGVEALLETGGGQTAPNTTPSTDTDGDGIPDATEVADGTDPFDVNSPTTNGNNDADGDGITDGVEAWLEDNGGQAAPNTTPSTDTDGDGIPDATEVADGTDPFDVNSPTTNGNNDADGDGVTDAVEQWLEDNGGQTAPNTTPSTDTDGDGIPDATEVANGTDPFDVSDPYAGGSSDIDGDGISNAAESGICVTYPAVNNCPATTMTEITPTQDTDGDGIPDATEFEQGTNPTDANDPTTNGGNDTDGDGITDGVEVAACAIYPTLDNCPSTTMTEITPTQDTDGDGIPDATEIANGTDPTDADNPTTGGNNDSDGDGITDAVEALLETGGGQTAPNTTPSTDTDGDGIPDATEVANGSDPFDANSPTTSGGIDTDGDGITDGVEVAACAIYPTLDNCPSTTMTEITPSQDTDGDGIPDATEIANGTDPTDADDPTTGGNNDTDGDGITDGVEALLETGGGQTAPNTTPSTDTDGDGIPDATEVANGTDPFDANSPATNGGNDTDGDGITDGVEVAACEIYPTLDNCPSTTMTEITTSQDTDGDGIPDATEIANGTDPTDADDPTTGGNNDTDGDGITDGVEALLETGGGQTAPNTTPSTDTDGDGIPDATEVANGTDPFDVNDATPNGGNDTDGDGVTDGVEVAACAIYPTLDNCPSTTMTEITPTQDTDGDGLPDVTEIAYGTDPTDVNDPAASGGIPTITSHVDNDLVASPMVIEGTCGTGRYVRIFNSNLIPNPTIGNCELGIYSVQLAWHPSVDGTTQTLSILQLESSGTISAPVSIDLNIDSGAPGAATINAPAPGDSTPALGGTLSAPTDSSDTVEVTIDGNTYTAINNGDGTWSLPDNTISPALTDGVYDVTITVTDQAGNDTTTALTSAIIIDTTAPGGVTVDNPADNSTISTNTPIIAGTNANPGDTIVATGPLGETCSVVVPVGGNWSCTLAPALAEGGPQSIDVVATDTAGNPSPTTTVNLTVDTSTLPATPVVTSPSHGESINNLSPTLTGTGTIGSTITVLGPLGETCSAVVDSTGNWTCDISPALAEGVNNLTVTETDGASNVSSPLNFVLNTDLTAPTVTVEQDAGQVDPTILGNAKFVITFSEPIDGATLEVADIVFTGTASGTITSGPTETLPNDGTTYTFTVTGMANGETVTAALPPAQVTDLAGNANGASTSTDNQVSFDYGVDSDTDGIPDSIEALVGTNPSINDTDADGVDDDNNDLDNVSPIVELNGSNNGDGNGDGILDAIQNSVTAIPNTTTNKYNTIQTNNSADCAQISRFENTLETSLGSQDSQQFPLGLWDFDIKCANPGDSTTITIYLDKVYNTSAWVYKKFNSNTSQYTDISGLVTYGVAVVGADSVTTITYNITDGSALDEDGVANGVIVDPAGPTIVPGAVVTAPPVVQSVQNAIGHTIRYAGIKREDVQSTTEGWSKEEFAQKYEESMEFAAERNAGSEGKIATYIDNEGYERFAGYQRGEVAVSDMAEYEDLVVWRGDRQRADSAIDMVVRQRANQERNSYFASADTLRPKYRVQNFREISEEDETYNLMVKMNSLGLMRPNFDGSIDYEKSINVFDVVEFVMEFNKRPLVGVSEVLSSPVDISFVSRSGRRDSILTYSALMAEYLNPDTKVSDIMSNEWVGAQTELELQVDISGGITRKSFAQEILAIYQTIDPLLFVGMDDLLEKRFKSFEDQQGRGKDGILKSAAKKMWNRTSREDDQAQTILNRRKYEEKKAEEAPLQRRSNTNFNPADPNNPGWNPVNKDTKRAPINRGSQSAITRPEQARQVYRDRDGESEVDQVIRLKNKDSVDGQIVEDIITIQ